MVIKFEYKITKSTRYTQGLCSWQNEFYRFICKINTSLQFQCGRIAHKHFFGKKKPLEMVLDTNV